MSSVVVLVPIYQAQLSALDHFSLRHALAQLRPGREVFFIGPEGLDMRRHQADFPGIRFISFHPDYFASIKGYNRLLMSPAFYERFGAYEFTLILQTDAILLRDDLDEWVQGPYDYVGAPWPDGVEILVNLDRFVGDYARKVKVHVGNGGLSLRRNRACIQLMHEFPQALDYFVRTGSSEDLFFAIMGSLSAHYVMPSESAASRFALELKPERYFTINGQRPPMGGHAWARYNPAFWLDLLGDEGQVARGLFPQMGCAA
jgi:hypothetical protein